MSRCLCSAPWLWRQPGHDWVRPAPPSHAASWLWPSVLMTAQLASGQWAQSGPELPCTLPQQWMHMCSTVADPRVL